MKHLKCLFGKHNWIWQWKCKNRRVNIWSCCNCGLWYVQYYGIDYGFTTKGLKNCYLEKEDEPQRRNNDPVQEN